MLANKIRTEFIGDDREVRAGNGKDSWPPRARAGSLRVERHQIKGGIRRTFELNDASTRRDAADWRSISAKGYVAFEAGLHSDHCADEKSNYSIVSHDKADVPFLPRPPGERDCEKVDAKNGQPNLEPRGLVNVSLCDLGVEIRLRKGRDSASEGDRGQEDERELQGAKPMNHLPGTERLRRSAIICLRAGAETTVALMDDSEERPTFRTKRISLLAHFNHWRRLFSTLASSGQMKSRRIFWIIPVACILLTVLAALRTSVWMGRFLHSDAFRKLIATKTGEAFGSEAVYGPLRWAGSSLFSDSLEATGLPGSMVESLRADQMRADMNWRAIFRGSLESREDPSDQFRWDISSRLEWRRARYTSSAAARGIASLLPRRFEVGQVDIAQGRRAIPWLKGSRSPRCENSALRLSPDGEGWAIEGTGGVLRLSKLPALNVVSFRSRIQGDVFFLTDAQCRLGDTGRISASGEFASNSKLRIEWNQIDVRRSSIQPGDRG